ncbi:SMI1/KNR4 family protein [Aquisphaera insulae]|uniref:SMI1/KNR4 family protein n=1 Tax=Aquisphaera insulae TaxID=2712864 RepID=UPI0013EA81EF|nr:SMI1/KNR4 family protein [Aquisphaera insulae]
MTSQLRELVLCWMAWGGIDEGLAPGAEALEAGFGDVDSPTRAGAEPRAIDGWEHRHAYRLPPGLRAWLMLSNGLYLDGPLIHPISAIGPMVVFSRMDDLLVQPESWFEIGNPNVETVCIDLAYRWPGGGSPIFTSGDPGSGSPPRIIARSFEEWFLELLRQGGREYWLAPDFIGLGDPWQAHRRFTPPPELPERLRPFAGPAARLMHARADDREAAESLGLSAEDVELLFRHLQHVSPDLSPK